MPWVGRRTASHTLWGTEEALAPCHQGEVKGGACCRPLTQPRASIPFSSHQSCPTTWSSGAGTGPHTPWGVRAQHLLPIVLPETAGPFHEDASLQPAHPLCHCCSPAAQSLLLLCSLPSSHLGAVGLAVFWGTAGDRGLSPPRAVAYWLVHAGTTGGETRPSFRVGGCHSILPSPPASHLQCQAVLMA